MGLFDFLRRRADVPGTNSVSGADASGPEVDGPASADGSAAGSTEGWVDAPDRASDTAAGSSPVPPAWSLLPSMQLLSHQPIHRTFDTDLGPSLRAHRSADRLLATAPLGHTVDPGQVGVVDGLFRPVAPDAASPMAVGGDLVLRRKVLTAPELPAVDQQHPRWPILARTMAPVAPVAPVARVASSPPVPSDASVADEIRSAGPIGRVADAGADEPGGRIDQGDVLGSSALDASQDEREIASTVQQSTGPAETGSGSTASGSIVPASTVRGTAPAASLQRSTGAAPDRADGAAGTSAGSAPGPLRSLPIASTLGSSAPITRLTADAGDAVARRGVADATWSTSTMPTPSGDDGMPLRRLDRAAATDQQSVPQPAGPQPPLQSTAVLRRRSIVEVPSRRDVEPAEISRSADAGPLGNPPGAGGPAAMSGSADAEVARSGVAETAVIGRIADLGAIDASEPSADRPTLGRRPGLGEPLASLPLTAMRAVDDGDPFQPWATEPADLPLVSGSTESPDSGVTAGGGQLQRSAMAAGGLADDAGRPDGGEQADLRVDSPRADSQRADDVPGVAADAGSSVSTLLRVVSRTSDDAGPDADAGSGSGASSMAELIPPAPLMAGLLGDRPIGSSSSATSPSLLGGDLTPSESVVPVQRSVTGSANGSAGDAPTAARSTRGAGAGPGSVPAATGSAVLHRNVDGGTPTGGGPGVGAVGPASWDRAPSGGAAATAALRRTADEAGAGSIGTAGPAGLRGAPAISDAVIGPALRRLAADPADTVASGRQASGTASGGSTGSPSAPSLSGPPLPVVQRQVAIAPRTADSRGGAGSSGAGAMPSTTQTVTSSWSAPSWDASDDHDGGDGGDASGGTTGLIHREPDGAAPADGGGAADNPAAAATAAPGGASATGSTAQADADLDQLAGRLYERLRFRLRRELLDDRERAGLALDRVR